MRQLRISTEKTGYVMDTHTAVAYAAYQKYKAESGDDKPMVIVSTASPYKFTKDVMTALDAKYKDWGCLCIAGGFGENQRRGCACTHCGLGA